MMKDWEFLGDVAVDSGEIVIGDPCYNKDTSLSVRLRPGFGDGMYPVYVRRLVGHREGLPDGHPGRIAEVRIVCVDDEAQARG